MTFKNALRFSITALSLLLLSGVNAEKQSSSKQVPQKQALQDVFSPIGNFKDKVSNGEEFFRQKHPGLKLDQLVSGAERDGKFVKFKRWQSYWGNSLNEDGTFGDPTAYGIKKHNEKNEQKIIKSGDLSALFDASEEKLYENVVWENISYENYITTQIGMGRTTSIGFHPSDADIFYVGTAIGGVWKTSDGGATYTPLGDDLPFMAVSSVVVNQDTPSTLYIAVSDHVWYGPPSIGVYKSINTGVTWQPTALSFNFSEDIRIYWMEADPNDADRVFVATSDGLYLTENGFINVTKLNSDDTFHVKFKPGDSDIVYQGTNDGKFYKSTNSGSSFSLIEDFGNYPVFIATTPLDDALVYVRHRYTLHKSVNSGDNFPIALAMPETTGVTKRDNTVLAFSPSSTSILLGGFFDIYRSDNGGTSFSSISHWLGEDSLPLIHVDQRNIFVNPLQNDYVYFNNDGGLYRYVVSTGSFENLSDGLMITQFYDIAVSQTDDKIIGGGSQDNGNVYRDTLGTWIQYATTGDGMNQDIDPTDEDFRYWAFQNGSLNRWQAGSGNTGITPSAQLDAEGRGLGAWETPFKLDPNNSNRLVAGYNRVYESVNKGSSWSDISGNIFGGVLHEIAIAKSNPERIYASRNDQLFIKSTADDTWTQQPLPAAISDLEVDPDNMNIVYVTTPGYISASKVYKSIDAGANWINISGSLPNISVNAIEIYEDNNHPGALFVGTDVGVYYKDNVLPDWQPYGDLPNSRVEDIEIQYGSKLIRVGTHGRGVFQAPIVINTCGFGDPDADNDGVCDAYDACSNFDNSLIGAACDDEDLLTQGEVYQNDCSCGGGTQAVAHCSAAGDAATGSDWINKVEINNQEHVSAKSTYSDFKDYPFIVASGGGAYSLTVTMNASSSDDAVYAWVDFDRNGLFEESERIAMLAINSDHQSIGSVVIPNNVTNSPLVMRVRSIYANPNTPQSCGTYVGEVEDYTLQFGYCDAQSHFGTGSDWIKNVTFNTIDNNSIQTFYSDFTDQSTDVARGESYPLEVTLNTAFNIDEAFVWIDYNGNKLFDAAEKTNLSSFSVGPNSSAQAMITIPDTALSGKTLMRVRSQYNSAGNALACGSTYAGEVEDYSINIGYCAAEGAEDTGSDWINNVTINTIDNDSSQSNYSNFKHLSTDLIRGTSYPIEVKLNAAFADDAVNVWVDFDGDGEFEDTERTTLSDPLVGTNSVSSGTLLVPDFAIQGETTMRVRSVYSAVANTQACGSYFGEVEDYTVNLSYCGAEGADGTGDDWISNVKLNTLDHATGKTSYSNLKENSTALYLNNSYGLEVEINQAFSLDNVHAWIDFDQNDSFTVDERIIMSDLATVSNSLSQGTFLVPPNTLLGETTLRVRVIYDNGDPQDPCGSYFGEVEDYSLIIADTVSNAACLTDVELGGETGNLASGNYKASNSLTSTSQISGTSIVKFSAGNQIQFGPGFSVANGGNFSAAIESCE